MEAVIEQTSFINLEGLTRDEAAFILDCMEKMDTNYNRIIDAPNSSPIEQAVTVEYHIYKEQVDELKTELKNALIKADQSTFNACQPEEKAEVGDLP